MEPWQAWHYKRCVLSEMLGHSHGRPRGWEIHGVALVEEEKEVEESVTSTKGPSCPKVIVQRRCVQLLQEGTAFEGIRSTCSERLCRKLKDETEKTSPTPNVNVAAKGVMKLTAVRNNLLLRLDKRGCGTRICTVDYRNKRLLWGEWRPLVSSRK